jgi:hypothetical protein
MISLAIGDAALWQEASESSGRAFAFPAVNAVLLEAMRLGKGPKHRPEGLDSCLFLSAKRR